VELLVNCPMEMAARSPGVSSVRISVEMCFGGSCVGGGRLIGVTMCWK
jgi:hypothetical protein